MKIVNTLEVPRLYSQKDDRFRYEAVKENVLGLKNICGEIVVYPPGASGASHHHVGTEHLFYITEGRGTMYVNEAPHEVRPATSSPCSRASATGSRTTRRRRSRS